MSKTGVLDPDPVEAIVQLHMRNGIATGQEYLNQSVKREWMT